MEVGEGPASWRDRRRRLAEAIFTLATNAMIGNQKAVPKLKMVLRLMSKFMHESGAACALPQPDASGWLAWRRDHLLARAHRQDTAQLGGNPRAHGA